MSVSRYEQTCMDRFVDPDNVEAAYADPVVREWCRANSQRYFVPLGILAKLDMTETTDDGREAGFEVAEEIPLQDLYAEPEPEEVDGTL